jgi:hypothetical protein
MLPWIFLGYEHYNSEHIVQHVRFTLSLRFFALQSLDLLAIHMNQLIQRAKNVKIQQFN